MEGKGRVWDGAGGAVARRIPSERVGQTECGGKPKGDEGWRKEEARSESSPVKNSPDEATWEKDEEGGVRASKNDVS